MTTIYSPPFWHSGFHVIITQIIKHYNLEGSFNSPINMLVATLKILPYQHILYCNHIFYSTKKNCGNIYRTNRWEQKKDHVAIIII